VVLADKNGPFAEQDIAPWPESIDFSAVALENPETTQANVHQVFETISDDYDRMNDLESFGLHRGWKRTLVKAVLRENFLLDATFGGEWPDILDVASGTGDIAIALAEALPSARIVGLDYSQKMLAVAERRAEKCAAKHADARPFGLTNLSFLHGDAMNLPYPDNSIAAVTISFGLRNLPHFGQALVEFARVLKPGGSLFCLEASYPTNALIKPFFKLYFKYLMPRMASLVVGHKQQYQWLNDSTEAFLSKQELAKLMTDCGFDEATYRSFFFGVAALHQARKA
jgi:demethylmenaquinone methyltransferase/2-methoxy-6-polyprenyl-1,4-benzoquinol methylase